ncbi:ABC transporter ATP-binding protein [Gimibacter soli]|uniref:ATP-binding cassette domain-containing protein n=1 Tax=Gimibacter soli TaxID=3024400 RepID=A0AAE9XL03_9PROT|nr:ATP-binding cassette domain-containing protein [Gimibacter soli]WCL52823.1 ATP-binding cassette domain-containing protein [Gimibacter soli]
MIRVDNVRFGYGNAALVLDGVSLSVAPGEMVALVGPSGCGKSTLLRLVAGLEVPSAGSVTRGEGAETGFVFQSPALLPWKKVRANVALPLELAGKPDTAAVQACLDAAGIGDLGDRYPASLSGGQAMRVSIARALVTAPDILLFDEPFAALDEIIRFHLNDLILGLKVSRKFASLFVTHSLYEAAYLADRILVMGKGRFLGQVVPGIDPALGPKDRRAAPELAAAVSAMQGWLEEAVA